MTRGGAPVITVKGLRNAFGEQVIHDGLDLTVCRGEIIGVVGGSGTGKSVLLRSIIGLQKPEAGEIEVSGPEALALCQHVATNDASTLAVGRAQYTIWCDENGGTIDDTILYRRGPERFLFCVNASNAATCLDWIQQQARGRSGVEVRDRSDATCLLALQGPKAVPWLASLGAGFA